MAGLLLGPALVSGCTTSSSIDTASTFNLALPETVEVIPSLSDGTALTALASATAETSDSAEPAVVTASYAGSTPTAGALAAASPIAPAQTPTAVPAADAATPAAVPATAAAATAPIVTASLSETVTDEEPGAGRGEVDRLIVQYASLYEVPVELVRRVVKRESNFFPGAYNKGHWGLMQIKHGTARGMGYQGVARGLLDAETNLKYAVKYLRGAFLVADGNHDLAVRYYAR
ncbi:transglycosylase SLT domain-containing protein, partial [Rhizobiaceae sp. 2RAB30]